MSLTSPLGLMRHVRRPDLRMEVIPWLNVLLVGWMMYLLSSSYIWAPGLVVGSGALPVNLNLPTLPVQPGDAARVGRFDDTLVIIPPPTPTSGTVFILHNGRFTLNNLLPALEKLRKTLPNPKPVLLIKGDKAVSLGVTTQVFELAQEAGFDSMVAYQPAGNAPDNSTPAGSGASAASTAASSDTEKKP